MYLAGALRHKEKRGEFLGMAIRLLGYGRGAARPTRCDAATLLAADGVVAGTIVAQKTTRGELSRWTDQLLIVDTAQGRIELAVPPGNEPDAMTAILGQQHAIAVRNLAGGRITELSAGPEIAILPDHPKGERGWMALRDELVARPDGDIDDDNPCSKNDVHLLRELATRKQQSVVDRLFRESPPSAERLRCIIWHVGSDEPLSVAQFRPPYDSHEGVWHHGYSRLGDLLLALLPQLSGQDIAPWDVPPVDTSRRTALRRAWWHWASSRYSESTTAEARHR